MFLLLYYAVLDGEGQAGLIFYLVPDERFPEREHADRITGTFDEAGPGEPVERGFDLVGRNPARS